MEGILLLVALIAVYILWSKFTSAAQAKVNQAIFRGVHNTGQAEVTSKLNFEVPVKSAVVSRAIVEKVNALPEAPTLVAGLYLQSAHDFGIVFASGTKLATGWVVEVELVPIAQGTAGVLSVSSWTEANGLVVNHSALVKVRTRVQEAVEAFGGQFVVESRA